jgi:hypothetical protein
MRIRRRAVVRVDVTSGQMTHSGTSAVRRDSVSEARANAMIFGRCLASSRE